MKDISHIYAQVPAWHQGLDSGESNKLRDLAVKARALMERRPKNVQDAVDKFDRKAELVQAEFEALRVMAESRLAVRKT